MTRAHITRIVPVSDQILLLIFKDTQTEKHDAKFFLHQIPDVKPRSSPDDFKAFLHKNKHVIPAWEYAIKCGTPSYEGETIEVTLSIPADEWAEVEAAFADMHVTIEQVAVALANFSVEPGAEKALNQWFDTFNFSKTTLS